MDEEEEKLVLVQILIDLMERISSITDFWNAYKKPLCNLSRRINLLVPMFEELKENKMPLFDRDIEALFRLRDALDSAKELLQLGSHGSKIFLALKWDKMMEEVTIQLLQALDGISFENFDISDEVREQFDLVHAQFKRANGRTDHMLDVELYDDIYSIYDKNIDADPDPTILGKLAENLQLMTITDLKQESLALQEMVVATGGRDPGQSIEKMSMLLKEIKDFLQIQNPEIGHWENSQAPSSYKKLKHHAIPEDFRCPISLELMKDPVIVCTGQTYERACIEKWLRGGHGTCPKTQQKLSNMSLTPNFLLRSLISQWCEANGVEPPKCPPESNKPISGCTPSERSNIESLIIKLSSLNLEDQRSAAGEIRLLAKRNTNNRMCIAESGAIPILISLLATDDFHTQEHAVTALLNLSILEENKGRIISLGAVTGIVHVVKNGSMEARENGAAALFSLSVIDEYKVAIGQSGAIPALVSLLNEGSLGGKKDAASALFNLCIYPGNKAKAVRAGVVTVLLELLTEPESPMMDEALAVLAILSSHHESKVAIGAARAVPVLVDVIETASPRNRENAAAVLLHLCSGEFQDEHLIELQERGVVGPLMELASNGTERAKRKAAQLIERINQFVEQQEQAQAIIQADSKLSRKLAFTTFSDV